jgi:hypothetical protein
MEMYEQKNAAQEASSGLLLRGTPDRRSKSLDFGFCYLL